MLHTCPMVVSMMSIFRSSIRHETSINFSILFIIVSDTTKT